MLKKTLCLLLILALLALPCAALTLPEIDAKAALLYEASSGELLLEQNADERLYPASTTKLMTAALVLEYGAPEDIVTVTREATDGLYEQGSAVYLIAGEEMAFMDMVRYLLVASGNDAANALAIHISGSIPAFVELMNNKAAELGCTGTHFTNTHGLPDENHYTTARDLLKMTLYAMENEMLAAIVQETSVVLPVTNRHAQTTTRYSTNFMLAGNRANPVYAYEGCLGIKTGSTTAAGLCFVSAIAKDDLTYYTVILGAQRAEDGTMGSFVETRKLFDFALASYSNQVMLASTEPICEVPVRLGADKKESVLLTPEGSLTALLPNDFSTADLELDYSAVESVDAPVTQGQALGLLTVRYNGKEYGTLKLVAASEVARSQTLYVIDRITSFLASTTFKIIIAVIVLLLALLVGYVVLVNRRRAKRRRRRGGGGRHI